MVIYEATSSNFKKYGRIVKNIDFGPVIEALNKIVLPAEGVAYEPTVASLEEASAKVDVSRLFGGELKLETGYCAGHNTLLNAVEYHRSSEVNVAATDCILLLGSQQDVTDDFHYDTSKIEAFHIRKGTAVELYATTLHYAPCSAKLGDPFRVVIILPKGTNYDKPQIEIKNEEDKRLFASNKWLIAHPEASEVKSGAVIGISGENIDIAELIK